MNFRIPKWLLLSGVLFMGCAARPATLNSADREALRGRALEGHGEAKTTREPTRRQSGVSQLKQSPAAKAEDSHLPVPPTKSLWADGRAATQAEAVRQARRQVSEQIVSRISSESRTVDSLYNGREDVESTLKIRTSSQFEHAELIKTIGVIREGRDFVARVVLHRAEAIKIYAKELALLQGQAERIGPALRRAIETHDTAILLNTKWAPTAILKQQLKKANVLNILGRETDVRLSQSLQALAKRAVSARSRAVIRLQVSGNAPTTLQRAVIGKIGALLAERNCQFAIHDGNAATADVPTADARLRVVTRDHREFGAVWRYVGFELYVVDARTKSPVFHLTALPEFVHGGGPSWAMADQAVIRRLDKKLRLRYGSRFDELSCR